MKIAENKVVTITYRLGVLDTDNEESIIENVEATEPMAFIFGMSGLPEGFERQIEGLESGSDFNFSVNPEEGYGFSDEDAIVDLPLDMFQIEDGKVPEGMLHVGNMIPMTNEEGHSMTGQVIEVGDDSVTIDFNHPLADRIMHFVGKVISVRDAQAEELAHGHVHGVGGVEH